MAKCSTNKTDRNLFSLLNYAPVINKLYAGQEVQDTIRFLDTTTEFINKVKTDEGNRYGLKDSNLVLKHTVTEILNPKSKGDSSNFTELGHFAHSVYESIAKVYIEHEKNYKKNLVNTKKRFLEGENGFKLTAVQFENLVDSFDLLIQRAQTIQDGINKRSGTNEKFVIKAEQKIVDPDYTDGGIGGTIDLLFLFSNNTAGIIDFKSSGWELQDTKMRLTHQPQLTLYKQILIKSYGVDDVLFTDVVPLLVKLKPGTKEIKSLKVSTSTNNDPKVAVKAGEFNKIGYRDIDAWIKKQYNLIQTLTQKIKSSKNKEEKVAYSQQIDKLRKGIKHFLNTQQIDANIEYINTIMYPRVQARLAEGFYDNFESDNEALKDLNNIIDEISIYADLGNVMLYFFEENFEGEELKKQKAKVHNIQGWAQEEIKKLEAIKNRIALPEFDITSDSMKEIGFFGKWATRLSDIDNPVFKKLSSIVLQMERKKDLELRNLVSIFEKLDNNLKLWAKKNNLSNKDVVKMIMNDKGMYHNKLSKEATLKIVNAWDKKNIADLKEIYEIRDSWKERYSEKLAAKKEELLSIYGDPTSSGYDSELTYFIEQFDLESSDVAWTNGFNKYALKQKESYINDNLSEEYKKIQSIPELKAWYNQILEFNEWSREALGITDYKELPPNFYPNVRAEIAEIFLKDPKTLLNNPVTFMNSLVIQEDDNTLRQYNEHGEIKEIPIFYVNPIDAELKSYDILSSTILFAKMAVNYKYAKEYENNALALRSLLAAGLEDVNNLSGKRIWDYAGEKVSRAMDKSDTLDIFDKFVDFYYYGVGTQDKGVNFRLFGVGPEINSTKATQAVLNKTRQMALGFKVVAGLAGGLAATTAMYVNSYKNGVHTREQLAEARSNLITDRKRSLAFAAFIDGGMENSVAKTIVKSRDGLRKWVNERLLYAPFRVTDEGVGQTLALAMSKNYGVDPNGNIKRLANLPKGAKSLYELSLKYDLDSKEEFSFEGFTPEESKEIAATFRQMTRRALYNITGSQAEEDIYAAKTSLMGQVLMQFKTWMPGVISERTGKYKVDDILDLHTVGRYRAAVAFLKSTESEELKKNMSTLFANLWRSIQILGIISSKNDTIIGEGGVELNAEYKRINLKKAYILYQQLLETDSDLVNQVSFQQFIDTYEGQLKALVVEVRVLLTLFLTLLCMGLASGDDDDKPLYTQNWAYRQLYKVSKKTLSEIMYFYDPTSLTGLIDSGIPMVRTIKQAFKIISNGGDEFIDLMNPNDDKRDKAPLGYYTLPFIITGFNGVRSVIELYPQDEVIRTY